MSGGEERLFFRDNNRASREIEFILCGGEKKENMCTYYKTQRMNSNPSMDGKKSNSKYFLL